MNKLNLLEDIVVNDDVILESGSVISEFNDDETIEDFLGGDYDVVTHVNTRFGFALVHQEDNFVEFYLSTSF